MTVPSLIGRYRPQGWYDKAERVLKLARPFLLAQRRARGLVPIGEVDHIAVIGFKVVQTVECPCSTETPSYSLFFTISM